MAAPMITVVGSFAVGMTIRTVAHAASSVKRWSAPISTWARAAKAPTRPSPPPGWGRTPIFAGIIGDDKLGEIATDLYAREGVDTTYLHKTTAMATGVGFIILNERGRERHHPRHGAPTS